MMCDMANKILSLILRRFAW